MFAGELRMTVLSDPTSVVSKHVHAGAEFKFQLVKTGTTELMDPFELIQVVTADASHVPCVCAPHRSKLTTDIHLAADEFLRR